MAVHWRGTRLTATVHHFQEHVMRACEVCGIEPDCKMHFQSISGDFGLRASRQEAAAVPQRSVSTRSNRSKVFAGLVREQVQALAARIIPDNTSVGAAFRPLLKMQARLGDANTIVP